jgi:TonB-linked SusC/RagA family outer membrane protein
MFFKVLYSPPGLNKILRVMKLTAFILFAACMQVCANGFSQRVTLSEKNASLETVFSKIEQQTGYSFWYKVELLRDAKKVTLETRNADLEEVLRQCFKDQPLTYTVVDRTIVVKEKMYPPAEATSQAPPIIITGQVIGEDGKPLPGATVSLNRTKTATKTNAAGFFNIDGEKGDVLTVSYVGYLTISVRIEQLSSDVNMATVVSAELQAAPEVQDDAGNNATSSTVLNTGSVAGGIVFRLVRRSASMQEVVINKGYYTEKQRTSVSSVSHIDSKVIEKQPVNNVLLALQGRVPGLFITQSTGVSGSGVTVQIEGKNSIGKGNLPLYVIDGVPYPSQLLYSINSNLLGSSSSIPGPLGGLTETGPGNPLSFINPADIESIDVLKDADATAIYGSRAANGAILITTKKGRAGNTKVNINVQNGWGRVTRKMDLLNTKQYLDLRKEGLRNDNIDPNSPPYNDPFVHNFYMADQYVYDSTRYTDWQKVLIGGTAKYTDAQASISGGNEFTQILFSTSYHKETTVFPRDFSDQKGSFHFNMNHRSANRKFSTQFSGIYLFDDNRLPSFDLTKSTVELAPNSPALYTADGAINWQQALTNGSLISTFENPLARFTQDFNIKTHNVILNTVIGYEILPGLNVRSSFGYNRLESDEFQGRPLEYYSPEEKPTAERTSIYGRNLISSWQIEPVASYKVKLGPGKIEALVGGTVQQNHRDRSQIRGRGYSSDQVMRDMKSAGIIDVQATFGAVYKFNSLFSRLNYNVSDKYIINLTARRDGSTRFGADNLFHTFGSVAGAWVFSNENFMTRHPSFISFGKLRASYGTTGNDQIEDYLFLSNLVASTGLPYGGVTGIEPFGLPNPKLQWEETNKLQAGIDLGLFGDRVTLNAGYFRNRSSNQLLAYPLPTLTGNSAIGAFNLPATVQNYGWELTASGAILKKALKWTSSINITIPKNKLIAFPNIEKSAYANTLVIGQPITIIKVYKFAGVNPATGLYQVVGSNGTPTTNPNYITDRNALINTAVKFYGGLNNNFHYKNFELDFLLQFVKQTGRNFYYGNLPGQFSNQPAWVLDNRWTKPGDQADRQKLVSGFNFANSNAAGLANNSDAAYSDASFVRLRNASLSWQLPDNWMKKIKFQQCRLYMQGQNLLTITNFKGLDPENQSTTALPPLKVMVFGIQLGL